jgi:hypothetical protein
LGDRTRPRRRMAIEKARPGRRRPLRADAHLRSTLRRADVVGTACDPEAARR